MTQRALTLALALLLLLTQQLGVQHRWSHGSAGAAHSAPWVQATADASPAPAEPEPVHGGPADSLCQVCLLLAALAAAALPALLCLRGLARRGVLPPAALPARRCGTATAPYLARAPPR